MFGDSLSDLLDRAEQAARDASDSLDSQFESIGWNPATGFLTSENAASVEGAVERAADGATSALSDVRDTTENVASTARDLSTAAKWASIAVVAIVVLIIGALVIGTIVFLGKRWLDAAPEFLGFIKGVVPA